MERVEQKAIFEQLLQETGRPGINSVLDWLNTTDFYRAPASAKYHGSHLGGLLAHSINVYTELSNINKALNLEIPHDTVAIAGLLHDVCKANTYKIGYRNVKNEELGIWEKKQIYEYDDQVPYGHGEKSVIILQGLGLQMNRTEMMMIRFHMGGFIGTDQHGLVNRAADLHPEIAAMHAADWIASVYLDQKGEG